MSELSPSDSLGHPLQGSLRDLMRRCVIAALAFGFLVSIGSLLFKQVSIGNPDVRAIEATRALYLTQVRLGVPLVGTPDLSNLDGRLAALGLQTGAPVLIRIFKLDFELELWMMRDGRYIRFATYPICRWSGSLGPKARQGDRQAPEGFYAVSAAQMNPHSRWHRSFDVGFPNAFDRSFGRTGSALMVHGGCSSAGCYAMTNPVIDEIWSLTTAALGMRPVAAAHSARQKRFQVQTYPFRMTEQALEKRTSNPHIGLWRELKEGHDLFERTGLPPSASHCDGHYRFAAGAGGDGDVVNSARCATLNGPNKAELKKDL
jgi:murein L,D-transpeptidase YafK